MKKWVTMAALLAAVGCAAVEEKVMSTLLEDYVAAQRALAADDQEAAQQAFQALSEEVGEDLKVVALEAAQSDDLKLARTAFKTLSERLIEAELPKGLVVAYCPMADDGKGASWIQPEGDIANPYFGKEMLECGEVKRKGGS